MCVFPLSCGVGLGVSRGLGQRREQLPLRRSYCKLCFYLDWTGQGSQARACPSTSGGMLPPRLICTLGSQRLWSPPASRGTGTADEGSAVSPRTLARARNQLEASTGVCSRQMALSDLAPGNCARQVTLGGAAEAWAPRVALGADSGAQSKQESGGTYSLPAPCTTHSRILWEDFEAS